MPTGGIAYGGAIRGKVIDAHFGERGSKPISVNLRQGAPRSVDILNTAHRQPVTRTGDTPTGLRIEA